VDVVYITTPNSLHCGQTLQAAQAGKHVLCEKPMALSVADALTMIRACRDANVTLGVSLQNRHHPAHVEARRQVQKGDAGQVTVATAQYSHDFRPDFRWSNWHWRGDLAMAGGGSLMGMGLHCIDLLRFVLGREVETAYAFSDEDLGAGRPDETTVCLLRFQGPVHALVINSIHVPHARNDLVLYGSQARIEGVDTVGMPWKGHLRITKGDVTTEVSYPSDKPTFGLFVRVVEDFNRAVLTGTEPAATGADGLALVRIADAIQGSARRQKAAPIATE
ncbi:MAG: Gfo/Idh/MocA family protein, partial [Dehalococcoidia bacterium]